MSDNDNNINHNEEKPKGLSKFRKKYPGIVMIVAVIGVFGTLFTTTNLWFGVQVRPTWHWEYTKLADEVNILRTDQLDLMRVLLSRDVARFKSLRDGYIARGDVVPDWLDEEIATITSRITRLGEKIDKHKTVLY